MESQGGGIRTAPFRRTPLRWILSASATILSAGCATIVGGAIEAATGGKVAARDADDVRETMVAPSGKHSDEDAYRSVHLRGPTPGWEHRVLRPARYEPSPRLFNVDLTVATCPVNFIGRQPGGLFETPAPRRLRLIDAAPSNIADPRYYRFGEVSIHGPSAASSTGIVNWVPPQGPWACFSLGLPPFGFRPPAPPHALR